MKKNFLETWRASTGFGQQKQWVQAQGSSLNQKEIKTLDAGGVVEHPKSKGLTKVFVKDETGQLWSVIIRNVYLEHLENGLKAEIPFSIHFQHTLYINFLHIKIVRAHV